MVNSKKTYVCGHPKWDILVIIISRYSSPVTPLTDRICQFCDSQDVDTEEHFVLNCQTFTLKRNCFFGRMSARVPEFSEMCDKLLTVLCPVKSEVAKTVSTFLGIMSDIRRNVKNSFS